MAEQTDIRESVSGVGEHLEQLRAQLEGLSEAIWRGIDHDDPVRLEEGVRFKQTFNERRAALEDAMGAMLELLRRYPQSGPGKGAGAQPEAERGFEIDPEPEAAAEAPARAAAENAPAAGLVADLEKKVPFGFVFSGQTFTSASAWPLFYESVLQELYGRAPEKLSRLADPPGTLESGGRRLFARVPDGLDDPLPIADALFAEADLDPSTVLQVIRRLVRELGYPLDSFKILLKEKNRGTVETFSIAA